MKRTHKYAIFTAFVAVAWMFSSATAARAQHGYRVEKPLKFAAGKTSKTVKGRIPNAQETHEYKFKARAGQFVEVVLKPGRNADGGFSVLNAADEQIGEDAPKTIDWEGTLSETGEYRVNVHSNGGAMSYILIVTIVNQK